MNTNITIGLILATAVVTGGYWLYSSESVERTLSTGEEKGVSAPVGKTFAQLLGMGQSLECFYEYNDGANVSSGTMFIANGGEKLRGEFNIMQSGAGPMQMYMVRADGYNYMWGSAMPRGIKTKVTEENRRQLFDNADANAAAINNTEYKCKPWSVDANMFAAPTNVQFMDMSDLSKMMGAPKIGEATMKTDGTAPTDMKAMQCAACDQAGAAKEQCRQALGCK